MKGEVTIMDNSVSNGHAPYGVPTKTSPVPTHVGGVALCLFCTALTFIGTRTIVNGLTRSAADQMAQAQVQVVDDNDTPSTDGISVSDDKTDVVAETIVTYDYTTDQLNWAHQYHITWDENGNPIDEKGNVVDDPTTDVNEVARAIGNGTANRDGMSTAWLTAHGESVGDVASTDANTAQESVIESPYEGKDNVSRLADGTYVYTVQSGDYLSRIASKFGTTTEELVKLNGISNPSLISVGQQIKLPSVGVTDNGSGAGLG